MNRAPLTVAAIVLAACDASDDTGVLEDASDGPAIAIGSSDAWDDRACAECHVDAAAQWADSRHHTSFSNADFQRAYAGERKPFCRECHAPALTRAQPLPGPEAEALGVGCLECHGSDREGVVVTGPGLLGAAPHDVQREPDFGTTTCARCHEFAFPKDSRRPAGTMMQRTASEMLASPHADRSCADCHFPAADHSLASSRDPAAARAALEVTAARDGEDLLLTLEPHDVGHAFPTGDLYRRLKLHAELRVGGVVVDEHTRYLARHFAPWRRDDGSLDPAYAWPVRDDRVTERTTIRLPLRGDGGGVVTWWVDYERVDDRDHAHPERSTLASEVRLDEGVLGPGRAEAEM